MIVQNQLGLHARAAVKFFNTANRFSSDIKIGLNGVYIDGKSILGIMTLGAIKGSILTILADGPDAEELMKAMRELFENMFGEKD
jgi:phosphocarrier protein HPr